MPYRLLTHRNICDNSSKVERDYHDILRFEGIDLMLASRSSAVGKKTNWHELALS